MSALASLLNPILDGRARRMARAIRPFLDGGGDLLDVGCGSGRVGWEIHRQTGAEVVGTDVLPSPESRLRVIRYDGVRLPFPDEAYSNVLLCFVLHHCADPLNVLREAARVSQRRILIAEDITDTPLQSFFARVHDWAVNKITEPDMALPYGFRSENEWRRVFDDLHLRVVHRHAISSLPWVPVRQTLFVLDKRSSGR